MFIGSLPDPILAQVMRSIDFDNWTGVQVICSGSFKFERIIHQRHQMLPIYGNDVSLLTTAIGSLAAGKPQSFTFTDDLDWLEQVIGADCASSERVAALIVAITLAQYARGKRNIYKQRHLDEAKANLPAMLASAGAKLDRIRQNLVIEDFYAVDFRTAMRQAIAKGHGIIGAPPTYKGGYENIYRYIHQNVQWDAPKYDVYDPSTLPYVIDEIDQSGVPWCIISDYQMPGRKHAIEFHPGRNKPLYGYAKQARPSYVVKSASRSQPFAFTPIDTSKLHAQSSISFVPVDSAKASYLKDVYLAKNIIHTPGMVNLLVIIDGMLAGMLVFSLSTHKAYHKNEIYLLSDLATSREGRLSKLIAELATCTTVIRHLETRLVRRFEYVATTAFARGAVSMKYRGIYKLLKRLQAPNGFMLNYGRDASCDDHQAVYTRWFKQKKGAGRGDSGKRPN